MFSVNRQAFKENTSPFDSFQPIGFTDSFPPRLSLTDTTLRCMSCYRLTAWTFDLNIHWGYTLGILWAVLYIADPAIFSTTLREERALVSMPRRGSFFFFF
jgi:hypothetical protein